jgi:hypothetical protein
MEYILDFHEFHKMWVIESLREGDLKTGTRLFEDRLLPAQSRHRNLEVVHRSPTSKSELVKVLETIRDEALHQGLYPLIHFDCHGDLTCLQMTNGDQLTWEELRLHLIAINLAYRCNLLIVVAACNGIHLIKCSTQLDRAPFYAVIGAKTDVKAGEIDRDFQAFYSVFFNGDDALRVLNNNGKEGSERTYHFVSSAGIFASAYRTYYSDHCVGKGLAARREELLTTLLASLEVKKRGFRWLRKMIKEALSHEDEHFVELRDRFFFLDKFPENKGRFDFPLSDVLQQGELLKPKKNV